jgi:SulP family sulfate permease
VVSWNELLKLVPIALSCFVIIIVRSAATARVFAVRHHERVNKHADTLGLSAANAVAALLGAFVVNGSPTQTAMADLAGARSQVAQLVFAGVVLLVLLLFTGPLQYLPRSVLVGIVFTVAIGLVDIRRLRDIRKESPGEFWLAIITAAVVALAGLEQGILAVSLSLLRHVRHSYRLHTMILAQDEAVRWLSMTARPGLETEPGLVVYRFGADLFYAITALQMQCVL